MSNELTTINDGAYKKYEELLLKRDELRKESFQLERAYMREFGDLILEVFQMKIECIRKKKSIEYCQYYANRGENVDQDNLQAFLQKEMEEYQSKLDDMIKDNDASKKATKVAESDLMKIKKIYHRLVKQIHPDINPEMDKNEELKELWTRLVIAYNCNDLKEMQETEVLITAQVSKLKPDAIDIKIPNIDERLEALEAEIEKIRSTDPYRYKFLLDDEDSVETKKKTLRDELKEYEEYGKQLDAMLESFVEKGVTFTWRMN